MNYKLTAIILLLVFGLIAGWFFFVRDTGPRRISNPPTAEELERIEEIEQSSSQVDPNAKAGVGVQPVGTLPPPTPPTQEATSTEQSIPLEAGSDGTPDSTGTTTEED